MKEEYVTRLGVEGRLESDETRQFSPSFSHGIAAVFSDVNLKCTNKF